MIIILITCCLSVSFTNIIKKWKKALDDEFIEIREENEGWNDHTYLYGVSYGFFYYVTQLDTYKEDYLDRVSTSVNNSNLPPRFWAWQINWGGDGWRTTTNIARSIGYIFTVYNDSGYEGQLAYCELAGSSYSLLFWITSFSS